KSPPLSAAGAVAVPTSPRQAASNLTTSPPPSKKPARRLRQNSAANKSDPGRALLRRLKSVPHPLAIPPKGISSMALFTGKKGLVLGVANEYSIAWAISKQLIEQGAEVGFTHLPGDKMERRVRRTIPESTKFLTPCDVSSDEDV